MLQVRDLAVEVGGVPIVEDLSFSLRAGEKVGLVGRNGAGKTSLLRVLAGEEAPVRGAILRQGRLGYLAQDPRVRREESGVTARGHGLAPWNLEKLRLTLEEDPSQRNVARYSRAEEQYRDAGGYSAEADAR